jgi:hypothetical protein
MRSCSRLQASNFALSFSMACGSLDAIALEYAMQLTFFLMDFFLFCRLRLFACARAAGERATALGAAKMQAIAAGAVRGAVTAKAV